MDGGMLKTRPDGDLFIMIGDVLDMEGYTAMLYAFLDEVLAETKSWSEK